MDEAYETVLWKSFIIVLGQYIGRAKWKSVLGIWSVFRHMRAAKVHDRSDCASVSYVRWNIGIKHGFSCINIRQVPWEVLKTEAEGRGFQHLPRGLANVNALKKKHVRSLFLLKNWNICYISRYFLHYFVLPFLPMSRERYFHGLSSFWGRAVHISWRQQFCGSGTSILKVA